MRKLFFFVCLVLASAVSYAQTVEASGRVTDDKGNPIPRASVKEKSSRRATSADANGNFKLSVASGATIVVTAAGFESVEVAAGTGISVQMVVDVKALNEVVVTGTGIATSKKKIAFAVEAISADKLPQVATADVGSALVGKIAGAQISSVSGSPGQPVNILLRGINSIRGGTLPLILIDGVEVKATSLESLDLNSYERVEVVQGPAAASLYGAQGANGVIQLFTKKGKQGKVSINFSSSASMSQLLNIGGVQKAKGHAFTTNTNGEITTAGGTVIQFDPVTGSYLGNPGTLSGFLINANGKFDKQYGQNLPWYDHYKMFFVNGTNLNNTINISGGKDKTDFSFIMSDNRQTTVFKNNGDFSRTNITANIGVEILKNLRFRTSTQLGYTNSTLLDPNGRSMFYAINNARPFANFEQKDALGLYSPYFGDAVGVNHYNFNYVIENSQASDKTLDIVQSFNLNYKFPKFVELDAKYGLNRSQFTSVYKIRDESRSEGAAYWEYWMDHPINGYSPRAVYNLPAAGDETGEITDYRDVRTFHNFTANATIRFDFEKDFKLKIPITSSTLIGWDYRKRNTSQYETYGANAPDYYPYNTTDMGVFQTVTDYNEDFATYGYLVNQHFDYGNYGGLTVGFRSDFSSAFGRGAKAQTFPHTDAYINLSSFKFYENSKLSNVMTSVKFRSAYGEAGVQPEAYDRFPTLNTVSIGGQSGLITPTNNRNPDLKVQVAKELEFGTDLTFKIGKKQWFNNMALSVTYWKRTAEDVIDQVDVAPSLGFGRQLTNSMSLSSNGIQASLNASIYSSKKVSWNLTVNFAKQKSVVDAISGNAELIKQSAAGSSQYVIKAGEKIGQLYGFLFLGQIDARDAAGNLYIPQADHGLYEVASNGYVVNKATRQPYATALPYAMGDPNPKFNMSFINDITIGNYLNVGFQLDWVYKSYLYNQTKEWMYRDGIHKDYDQPITIDGQTAAWTAFYRGAYAVRRANGTKNYFLEDASFLRLRNISIGFDFAKFFKLKVVSKAQLVLSGRNLFTVTKYTGMDPEVSSGTSNSSWDRGVDHNTIPNVKTYQIGLNIGF